MRVYALRQEVSCRTALSDSAHPRPGAVTERLGSEIETFHANALQPLHLVGHLLSISWVTILRRQETSSYGKPTSRPAPRRSPPTPQPWIHRGLSAHPRSCHRYNDGHLQRGLRSPASPVAL